MYIYKYVCEHTYAMPAALRKIPAACHREIGDAAVGPGGGSPKRLYKAPTDNTKPQKTIQSSEKTIQRPEILDRTRKC